MLEPQKTKSQKKPQARGFHPDAMAQAQALNQQPDSIPAMMKPGEYVLPPDTVQALGGPQVLDATVAQTHTPTNAGAIVPRGFKPRLFFNNGGLVQDEEQKPKPISPTNTYPQGSPSAGANIYGQSSQQMRDGAAAAGNFLAGAFPGTTAAIKGSMEDTKQAYNQSGIGGALGTAARTAATPLIGLADDVMGSAAKVLDPAAQALKTFVTGDATPIGQQPASAAPAAPAQKAEASGTGATAPERTPEQIAKLVGGLDRHHAQNVQLQAAARTPEQARAEAVQQTTGQQVQGLPGVYQHGRGQYSDNPQGMGFAPGFTGQPSAQNLAAADALARQQQAQSAARVAAAQQEPAARGFPGFAAPEISHSGNDWSARNELRSLRMAAERAMENAPRKRFAAQHPAVQAYQAALQADMAARYGGQAALQAKTNDTNAGLVREQMQQQGATQRDMARNAIEQQRVGLDGQRLGLAAQQQQEQSLARGFDIRAAQRREGILQQFDAAKTDEERAQLRQRYPDVFGDTKTNSPWKVSVTPATKNVDGSTSMGSVIRYNEQTGQVEEVKLNGAAPPLPAPKDPSKRVVGQVYIAPNGQAVMWDGKEWEPA